MIWVLFDTEDRKGVEDSSGYLKGPYRKVIEGAVLKLKKNVDTNGEEIAQQYT